MKKPVIFSVQESGINAADLKKLKDAGFNTSQSVAFAMRKERKVGGSMVFPFWRLKTLLVGKDAFFGVTEFGGFL